MVLGAQWLKKLGSLLMDYQALTMKFAQGPHYIELKGETSTDPTQLSYNHLCKLLTRDQVAKLRITNPDLGDYTPLHHAHVLNLTFRPLFHDHAFLLEESSHHLLLVRPTNHSIPLLQNVVPITVCLYR